MREDRPHAWPPPPPAPKKTVNDVREERGLGPLPLAPTDAIGAGPYREQRPTVEQRLAWLEAALRAAELELDALQRLVHDVRELQADAFAARHDAHARERVHAVLAALFVGALAAVHWWFL